MNENLGKRATVTFDVRGLFGKFGTIRNAGYNDSHNIHTYDIEFDDEVVEVNCKYVLILEGASI
ncbi:hypothetical protein [Halobacillus karajensis]|uniref:hypothetical protein n=1 Tax=Halobacillus karajensis TaxID=195088 RepID=UPI00045C54F5|nr:hypothetical protein [Halobacillus karajensis]CDQ21720.1 hypothetical protein BN982_04129 [Halobacillus karajensis]